MPKATVAFSLPQALLTSFDTNDRINQYMIENLPNEAWRAEPPAGKGRTVAMFGMWEWGTRGKV